MAVFIGMKRIFLLLVMLVGVIFAKAQSFNNIDEARAMIISNIVKYAQWETINGNFDILVLNNHELASHLKRIYANKKFHEVPVNIIEDKNNRSDFIGIEVLITGRKSVIQDNLLTFNFENTNAIVNLVLVEDKIKLTIRKPDLIQNKMKMSSSIMSIAKVIDYNVAEIKPDSVKH